MGKRMIRYSTQELPAKMPDFKEKEVDLVMKDGRTWHGHLLEISDGKLHFQDNLLRKRWLPLSALEEVVADFDAEW